MSGINLMVIKYFKKIGEDRLCMVTFYFHYTRNFSRC
jgi:hypothetical protein